MGGNIYSRHLGGTHATHVLASIRPFNLNARDTAVVLHVMPSGNAISIRSQEVGFRFTVDEGQFQINRFDFLLDTSSLMRFFIESH
jgi:hypothetical protein